MNDRIKELTKEITRNNIKMQPLKDELGGLEEKKKAEELEKLVGKYFIFPSRQDGNSVYKVLAVREYGYLLTMECNKDKDGNIRLTSCETSSGFLHSYCQPTTKSRFHNNMKKMLKVFEKEVK